MEAPREPESDDADARRRSRFVFAIGFGLAPIALSFGAVMLAQGRPWIAAVFVVVAMVALACPFWVRRGGSIFVVGNTLAGVLGLALAVFIVLRGGVHVPVAMAIAVVPTIATLIAGWKSGLAWTVLVLAMLGAVIAAPAAGVALVDQMPYAQARVIAIISPVLFVTFMSLVSFAYDATRASALRDKAASDRGLAEARAEAELARTNRLEALGQLSAAVAHEINNPLSYVVANVSFARERLADERGQPEVDAALAEALEGAERVQRIVGDLRTFTGEHDDEAAEPSDIAAALRAALKLTHNDIQHRARLETDIAWTALVPVGERRLVQVFVNLLCNAAQALEGPAAAHTVRVVLARDGDRARVAISDTGAGIAPEHLEAIFDPFFTTKPVGAGTGLGLSVCKNIVERAGGTLAIESAPGGGTTCTITLACVGEVAAPAPIEPAEPEPARSILVIDDDAGVRRGLRRTLRRHAVVDVGGALEALALLRGGAHFDVILCDLMMPEMDGGEFFDILRGEDSALADRVVFLTGGAITERARRIVEQHADRVLHKPFDPAALRAIVRAMPGPSAGPADRVSRPS